MLKPAHLPLVARGLILAGGLVVAVLMLAPQFQGAETAFGVTDKQAHAVAFYVFTLACFMAAPRMRRNDLALAALAIGAAAEAAQLLTGRSASFGDLSADAVGIALAWAPAQIERLRRLARNYPGFTFDQVRSLDRRRDTRAAGRAAGSPAEQITG